MPDMNAINGSAPSDDDARLGLVQLFFSKSEKRYKAHDKQVTRELLKRIDGLNSAYVGGSFIAEGKQLDAKMRSLVQNAPPRTYFPEVAYWNPRVVTDADGKATVRVVIPDSSTTWKIIARGITTETLAGRAAPPLERRGQLDRCSAGVHRGCAVSRAAKSLNVRVKVDRQRRRAFLYSTSSTLESARRSCSRSSTSVIIWMPWCWQYS